MCNGSQLVTLAPRVPESEDDGLQELVPDVEEHGDEDAGDANHLEVAMSGNREETYSASYYYCHYSYKLFWTIRNKLWT